MPEVADFPPQASASRKYLSPISSVSLVNLSSRISRFAVNSILFAASFATFNSNAAETKKFSNQKLIHNKNGAIKASPFGTTFDTIYTTSTRHPAGDQARLPVQLLRIVETASKEEGTFAAKQNAPSSSLEQGFHSLPKRRSERISIRASARSTRSPEW